MSNTLRVVQFGGQQVGAITSNRDGSLAVRGTTPELEQALQELVARITASPLAYTSGREVQAKDGLRHLTSQTRVRPGDPHYLDALADTLSKHRLGGKRIRGVVE